jgi:hypothetical protein
MFRPQRRFQRAQSAADRQSVADGTLHSQIVLVLQLKFDPRTGLVTNQKPILVGVFRPNLGTEAFHVDFSPGFAGLADVRDNFMRMTGALVSSLGNFNFITYCL